MLKKRNLLFLAVLLCPGTIFSAPELPNVVATTPSARIELFNGKDLTGWKFITRDLDPKIDPKTIWTVSEGVIHFAGDPKINLQTLAAYRDYHLHVEWRWPERPGNSGVFLHVTGKDRLTPVCIEAQLMAQHAGDLRTDGGAKWVPNPEPAVRPRQQPSSEKTAGEWNTYDIVCQGDAITTWVNGVLQNKVEGASPSSGYIALQAEGKAIDFRNIWIEPVAKP